MQLEAKAVRFLIFSDDDDNTEYLMTYKLGTMLVERSEEILKIFNRDVTIIELKEV